MTQTKKTPASRSGAQDPTPAGTKNSGNSQKQVVRQSRASAARSARESVVSENTATSSRANAVLVVPQPEIQQQQQGRTLRLHQKELLVKLSGLEKNWAVPLAPGWTGAPRLDKLAQQHAWARWDGDPKITFRSLAPTNTVGTYSYLVVHDATMEQLSDVKYWDTTSRQYTTNLATASFTHTIPVNVVKRQISMTTASYSWFLIKYDGDGVAPGELWLEYDVSFGGIADIEAQPRHFTVTDGSFSQTGRSDSLDGFPVHGKHNYYTFSDPPPTRKQVEDLLDQMKAKPYQIERVEGDKPGASDNTLVRGVGFSLPEGWSALARTAIGALGGLSGLKILKPLKFLLPGSGKSVDPGLFRDTEGTGFGTWSGTVTLFTAKEASSFYHHQPSLPPIPPYILKEGTESAAPALLRQFAASSEPSRNRIGALGGALAGAVADLLLDPDGPLASILMNLLRKWFERPSVVHKGQHAVHFFKVGRIATSGGENGDQVPDGENPGLPTVPDFNDDLLAPGAEKYWGDVCATFTGYVVDDNGTPLVHYLSANRPTHYVTAPAPVYYVNLKRPWDEETKRLLAFKVQVSETLKGHYLLAESYNWGDDGCGGWLAPAGGTYLGTVARFGAITCSRSVIRIDDPAEWNTSPEHLAVGQSKLKYRSADKGRAALFMVRYGIVGRYDVATNFLANWLVDPSVTRLINRPYVKGTGALVSTRFPTHSDFQYTRSAMVSDPNLDPMAPGFAANYAAHVDPQLRASLPPLPIEAGPFRFMLAARYDDANGWWQHVPIFAYTDTDVASKWLCYMRIDGILADEFGAGRQRACIAKVIPPTALTNGAFMCIETISLGGTEHTITDVWRWGKPSGLVTDFHSSCSHMGPIVINRRAIKFTSSTDCVELWSVGDSSLPTHTIQSYDGDLYLANITVAYLVRDEQQARDWVNDNITREAAFTASTEYHWHHKKVEEISAGELWAATDQITSVVSKPLNKLGNLTSTTGWNASGKVVIRPRSITGYSKGISSQECPENEAETTLPESGEASNPQMVRA